VGRGCVPGPAAGSDHSRRRGRLHGLPRRLIFNRRPHFAFPAQGIGFVALACTTGGPPQTPTKADQQLPDTAGMMANTKLALDQVRYTWAGPKRSFVTQSLRSLQKQCFQPFTVLLVEPRLAPNAPGPRQTRLAFAPILAYPAGHCCGTTPTRRATAAWVSPPLPQPNSPYAWLLKPSKIAAYSTRITRTYLDANNTTSIRYIMRDSIITSFQFCTKAYCAVPGFEGMSSKDLRLRIELWLPTKFRPRAHDAKLVSSDWRAGETRIDLSRSELELPTDGFICLANPPGQRCGCKGQS
jgi:hypothetical protein